MPTLSSGTKANIIIESFAEVLKGTKMLVWMFLQSAQDAVGTYIQGWGRLLPGDENGCQITSSCKDKGVVIGRSASKI